MCQQKNETELEELKDETESQFATSFRVTDEIQTFVQSVKTVNDEFRKKYGTKDGMTAIKDLVTGLQEADY